MYKRITFALITLLFCVFGTIQGQIARAQVISNISDTDSVDVYVVLGPLTLTLEVAAQQSTSFLSIPSGFTISIGIAPKTSQSINDTLKSRTFLLKDSTTYIAIASGSFKRPESVDAFIIDYGLEKSQQSGLTSCLLFNSLDPAVFQIDSTLVKSLEYGSFWGYIDLSPSIREVRYAKSNSDTVLIFEVDLDNYADSSMVLFPINYDSALAMSAVLKSGRIIYFPGSVRMIETEVDHHQVESKQNLDLSNYPNPFNEMTTIQFYLDSPGRVLVEIYDLLGNRVAILADRVFPEGRNSVQFMRTNLSTGVYFCKVTKGLKNSIKSMVLLK